MNSERVRFLLLNLGHFLDHFFMLVFASAAALTLIKKWDMSYSELIPYATPGFVAYAIFSLPSGWLADRWTRDAMMTIFFVGIGLAAIATSFADSPIQIGIGLTFIGVFAAIYHPVGIALVIEGHSRTGVPLAINGIFGNIGVGSAALITGFLIDNMSWRAAFVLPGVISVAAGIFHHFISKKIRKEEIIKDILPAGFSHDEYGRSIIVRVLIIVFVSTAIGGLIFQATTFTLPKIFDERLNELANSATAVGWYAFLVFGVAAFGQIIVGWLIDRYSVRNVFVIVAVIQTVIFSIMPGQSGSNALILSFLFMFAVFGQVPINDVLVGRVTKNEWRSRVLSVRYVLTFSLTGLAIPAISWIHGNMGFDALFYFLAGGATLILLSVILLPRLKSITIPSV